MEVHIYKGSKAKSGILEQFFAGKKDTICFVYYDSSRPYPVPFDSIMADRSVISINIMITGIKMLAESGVMNFIIYTNYTEEENKELIEALENINEYQRSVVIIMCQK